jgi:hypothetical protein
MRSNLFNHVLEGEVETTTHTLLEPECGGMGVVGAAAGTSGERRSPSWWGWPYRVRRQQAATVGDGFSLYSGGGGTSCVGCFLLVVGCGGRQQCEHGNDCGGCWSGAEAGGAESGAGAWA